MRYGHQRGSEGIQAEMKQFTVIIVFIGVLALGAALPAPEPLPVALPAALPEPHEDFGFGGRRFGGRGGGRFGGRGRFRGRGRGRFGGRGGGRFGGRNKFDDHDDHFGGGHGFGGHGFGGHGFGHGGGAPHAHISLGQGGLSFLIH
ncbi:probable H/ACA ribonucleoprotein complex subunit 1 [Scylla paramamosain]